MGTLHSHNYLFNFVGHLLYSRSLSVNHAILLAYCFSILAERSGLHHEVLSELDELPDATIPSCVET